MEIDLSPVPALRLSEAELAFIGKDDRVLVADIYQVCHEMARHGKVSVEEPAFAYAITPYPEENFIEMWFLYPPGREGFTYLELQPIMGLGHNSGDVIDAAKLRTGIEHYPEYSRVSLTVEIQMRGTGAPIRKTKEKVIIQTTVEYLQNGVIGSIAEGVNAHRQQTGTAFTNTSSPRSKKRSRLDYNQ